MSNQKSSGFTLIELLVVVLVISALSGILLGVINSSGIRSKARDSQRITALKKIQTALELYFADNRTYPVSAGSGGWEQIGASSDIVASLEPNYIDPVPTDPSAESGSNPGPCATPTFHRFNYKSTGPTYYITSIMEVTTSKDDNPCKDITEDLGCGTWDDTGDYCYFVRNP